MKTKLATLVLLVACLSGCPGTNDAQSNAKCPYDIDALYEVRTDSADAVSPVALWDWRNADCSREQVQVMCEDGQLVVVCEPCDGKCGSTTQTWTPKTDGSTTFEQIDSGGETTSSQVWLK
jgi:hypothetical protein